jgi:sigma-B regulation protein RsbU (phosphoserine phosphatase)
MVIIVIDPSSNQIVMVSAGHMWPIYRRTDGTLFEPAFEVGGLALGISDDVVYKKVEITLGQGESLTLYTDGINESQDSDGKLYSIDRIRGLIKANKPTVPELGQTIIDDVRRFVGRAKPIDDMCLVCLGRV